MSTTSSPPHPSPDIPAGETETRAGRAGDPRDTRAAWQRNKGMVLILLAEMAASSMDAIVRFLQLARRDFHAFQMIFARMLVTLLMSSAYMWWTSVPDFPLGKGGRDGVRGLLCLRALFGFGGLFCLYYSVHYLPLSEATVFRFLVPLVTSLACSILLSTPFTKSEFVAGLVALAGVVLIAHPSSIFGDVADDAPGPSTADHAVPRVTGAQRLVAIMASVIGIFGASGAYTAIRIIGPRAHALISVNYFALLGTLGSALALLLIPGISFAMPHGPREWFLLALLGVLGFVLQFLLTAGLQLDRSSKATSMMYTQVLFALGFDWGIWGVLPGMWSLVGGAVVVASTLWVALQKSQEEVGKKRKKKGPDEETPLLQEPRPEE